MCDFNAPHPDDLPYLPLYSTYGELCSRDVEFETSIFVSSSNQGVQHLVWGKMQVIVLPHKI